jgi:hypothetical protein
MDKRHLRNGREGWTPERRFLDKVEKTAGGCWLWTGSLLNSGYGQFWFNGNKITAHRFACEFYRGPVPQGLDVCHRCDVKRCVNPDHLFVDTTSGNLADMIAKGRSATGERSWVRKHPEIVKRGEQHGMAKATDQVVRRIRQLHNAGAMSISRIAQEVGLGASTVGHIINGDTWKHVDSAISTQEF